jgi:hypothetical protein
MSKTAALLASLMLAAERVKEVIPEDHHHYHLYDFLQAMIGSINREASQGIEPAAQVTSYTEMLLLQVNEVVSSYEFFESIQRDNWLRAFISDVILYPSGFLSSISSVYWQEGEGDDVAAISGINDYGDLQV